MESHLGGIADENLRKNQAKFEVYSNKNTELLFFCILLLPSYVSVDFSPFSSELPFQPFDSCLKATDVEVVVRWSYGDVRRSEAPM